MGENSINLPPPDDHSRISGVITALPASSSYYNISASKARLIDKSSENKNNNTQENTPQKTDQNNSTTIPSSPTSSTSSTLNESLSATIKQSIQNANDLSTKAAQYESKSSEKLILI